MNRLLFGALLSLAAVTIPSLAMATCDPGKTGFATFQVIDDQAERRSIPHARIEMDGVVTYTDAGGLARIDCIRPKPNIATISKNGYRTVTQLLPAFGDQVHGYPNNLLVFLQAQTLTTIGSTGTSNVTLNTQPGAYSVVGRTQIDDQNEVQLARLFDETPGVVSNHTSTSNTGSLGVQTSPNLRGTLDYEKTTLIDGHPVATGRFGDYVTTFLNTYMLQDVEIAKGPGAFAPLVVNGIGGSVNFRTRDPSLRPTSAIDLVADGYGGTLINALASDTIGKLGFVVDVVSYGTPGAFDELPTTVALPSGSTIAGVGAIGSTTTGTPPAGTPAGTFPIANAQNNPSNAYVRLTACCQPVDDGFLARSELVKARWRFSDATTLTAAYLGNQATFDLDGAQLQSFNASFVPTGASVAINPTTHLPSNVTEIENEPMLEAELRTTLRNDTLIGRWYSVSLNRFTGNATPTPGDPFTGVVTLTGSAPLTAGGNTPAFTGQPETVTIPNVFSRTVEEDRVHGGSIAWLHPAGPNDYELSIDRIVSLTNAYAEGAAGGVATFAASVPAGSTQTITSYMARGTFRPTDADALTLAAYATTYASHFSTGPAGTGFAFGDATHSELDPRVGYTHRFLGSDTVVRFAMGGSVTPPAFNVLSGVNQSVASAFRPGATSVTVTQNAGNLLPETSFGYDLGADARLGHDTIASVDTYLTNVRDQLVTTVTPFGTFTPPGATASIPVFASAAANAGNSRFYGLELSLRADPRMGFGYIAQGALMRAFAYDVSPSLYATATGPFTTNLAVIPGVNYTSTGTGFNGISNKGIPYAQGYAEAHYRTANGGLLLFGLTYVGSSNAYLLPAFTLANASLRIPLRTAHGAASLQISVDNLFDFQGGQTIATDNGIPVPLVNGKIGLVNSLPIGPRAIRIGLHLGSGR